MRRATVIVVFLSAVTAGQTIDKPVSISADALKPVPMSIASENRILKAEHSRDEVLKQEADLRDQFNQLQNASKQLQEKYADLQKKDSAVSKDVDEQIEAAWKESGLDKSKYSADVAGFVFNPKTEPKTEAKAAEKK